MRSPRVRWISTCEQLGGLSEYYGFLDCFLVMGGFMVDLVSQLVIFSRDILSRVSL